MNLGGFDIGVCSWSLRPKNMTELVAHLDKVGLDHVQLALGPLLDMDAATRDAEIKVLADAEIAISAGMIGFAGESYTTISSIRLTGGFIPNEFWLDRRARAIAAAQLAAELGLEALSVHAGFVPPGRDQNYDAVVDRMGELVAEFAKLNVTLLMETGQERDNELLQFINDLNAKHVGVNFDPANMLLYGVGDPVEAIGILDRHIQHVHIKDAIVSDQPGIVWGEEVPFGTGDVEVHSFLRALNDISYAGPLVIEREAGPSRVEDVLKAIETLQAHLGG